jgi:hypothetical protein
MDKKEILRDSRILDEITKSMDSRILGKVTMTTRDSKILRRIITRMKLMIMERQADIAKPQCPSPVSSDDPSARSFEMNVYLSRFLQRVFPGIAQSQLRETSSSRLALKQTATHGK